MAQPLSSCEFCEIVAGRAPASVVHRDDQCIAFMDIAPVTAGHLLVVPIEHATHLADLDREVGRTLFGLAQTLAAAIRRSDLKPEGINLFLADGEAAGQEVFHVHLHVLPRYRGDGFGLKLPAGLRPARRPRQAGQRRRHDRKSPESTAAPRRTSNDEPRTVAKEPDDPDKV